MQKTDEQQMIANIKAQLAHSAEQLDAATLSRLNQARQQALSSKPGKTAWLLPTAALSAGALALLIFVLHTGTPNLDEQLSLDDLDIIASTTDLDFYRDLEFYEWLENDAS